MTQPSKTTPAAIKKTKYMTPSTAPRWLVWCLEISLRIGTLPRQNIETPTSDNTDNTLRNEGILDRLSKSQTKSKLHPTAAVKQTNPSQPEI
ncbi:MAG: hypothetical protein M9920_03090 [Verrucomicrobiae bacterium]|nr:hypothetical protein [Verrucomicrobiae bacterium]